MEVIHNFGDKVHIDGQGTPYIVLGQTGEDVLCINEEGDLLDVNGSFVVEGWPR
jgi:hypothetical protein